MAKYSRNSEYVCFLVDNGRPRAKELFGCIRIKKLNRNSSPVSRVSLGLNIFANQPTLLNPRY